MWGLIVGIIGGLIFLGAGIWFGISTERKIAVTAVVSLCGGAIIAGIMVIFSSITSLAQNEVALLRNKITGEVSVMSSPGTTLKNPLTEKLTMKLTQVTQQYGNEDTNKGTDDYFPIRAGKGQEVGVAARVIWKAHGTDTIQKIYGITGTTDVKNASIVADIKTVIKNTAQKYVDDTTEPADDSVVNQKTMQITVPTLIGQKQAEFTAKIAEAVEKKLADYGLDLVNFAITDTKPGPEAQKAIDTITESSTKATIAQNDKKAQEIQKESEIMQAEKDVEIQGAKTQAQMLEGINKMLANPYIENILMGVEIYTPAVMVDGKVVTPAKINSQDIAEKLKSAAKDEKDPLLLQHLTTLNNYYNTWDGKLPSTVAGDKDMLSVMVPTTTTTTK